MNNLNQALALTLKNKRITLKLSQEALAEHADVHRTYISQLERGLKSPTLDTLNRIALAMNTDLVSLLEEMRKYLNEL